MEGGQVVVTVEDDGMGIPQNGVGTAFTFVLPAAP
jgi:chemotaxis protein histidine kinase CheA